MKVLGSAAKTIFYYKKIQGLYPNWKLQYKLKCKSTEYELSDWLNYSQIKMNNPRAIIAKEQSAAFGQNSKQWVSKRGGIWLSAAYPIFSKEFLIKNFSLSFAIKLCEMFSMESIKVNLKWPNDIFFDSRKLIGFLPRVVTRGKEIIYVRIGFGMNLTNTPPPEGISLSQIVNKKNISEHYWTAKILKTMHEAIESNDRNEYIVQEANRYLSKEHLPKGYSNKEWLIKNIDQSGNLRIFSKHEEKTLKRF